LLSPLAPKGFILQRLQYTQKPGARVFDDGKGIPGHLCKTY
jgi:hypothetical protein